MIAARTHSAAPCCVRISETPPSGWNSWLQAFGYDGFHLRSEWGNVFRDGLRQQPYYLWAEQNVPDGGARITGVLPLMLIDGPLFGRFLVSQPYLNTGGVLAECPATAGKLVDAAARLAEELDVRHLQLRHERHLDHPALNAVSCEKVHMRLPLPATTDELWDGLKSKVRSQIRRPLKDSDLSVHFGGRDRLDEFYEVFCRNMRDLGTPPFSRRLFEAMLTEFSDVAEICTVHLKDQPVASGFLLHGPGVTLIPSASSLRPHNRTGCNMLLYWNVLKRSVERGQHTFDFGRSSPESGTWRFKKQWGAQEHTAVWQYCLREGQVSDLRPGSGRFDVVIGVWKRMPVWLTRLIGPPIVRGIP